MVCCCGCVVLVGVLCSVWRRVFVLCVDVCVMCVLCCVGMACMIGPVWFGVDVVVWCDACPVWFVACVRCVLLWTVYVLCPCCVVAVL